MSRIITPFDGPDLEAFLAVVECRDFGRAADQLRLSVGALTDRIGQLEVALGVPLVDRDSSGFLGLTPAGHRVADIATTGEPADQPGPVVRLALPADAPAVAALPAAALATLGLVGVEPVLTPWVRLVPDLLDGAVDLALGVGESVEPGVASARLSEVRRVGVVARRHPLAVKRAVPVQVFARLPMLVPAGLPEDYLVPLTLADVRPLDEANLAEVPAASVPHRLLDGDVVTVMTLAQTAGLPMDLKRVTLAGCPPIWHHALRRDGDDQPELLAAIAVLADFTESISTAALG